MGYDVEWDDQGYEVHTGALDEGGEVIVADSAPAGCSVRWKVARVSRRIRAA